MTTLADRFRAEFARRLLYAKFDPKKHPRGQPDNAGQFASKAITQTMAKKLERQAKFLGGFTFRRDADTPATGFVVSTETDQEVAIPAADFRPETLANYLDERRELLQNDPQLYFGGWRDDEAGVFYLDLVRIVPDQETALRLAREHNQEAVYDLSSNRVIVAKPASERRLDYAGGRDGLHDCSPPGRRSGAAALRPTRGPQLFAIGFDRSFGERVALYARALQAEFDRRLRYRAATPSDGHQWVTVGSAKGNPPGEKGGTPVKIDHEGHIDAGPEGLRGRKIHELGRKGEAAEPAAGDDSFDFGGPATSQTNQPTEQAEHGSESTARAAEADGETGSAPTAAPAIQETPKPLADQIRRELARRLGGSTAGQAQLADAAPEVRQRQERHAAAGKALRSAFPAEVRDLAASLHGTRDVRQKGSGSLTLADDQGSATYRWLRSQERQPGVFREGKTLGFTDPAGGTFRLTPAGQGYEARYDLQPRQTPVAPAKPTRLPAPTTHAGIELRETAQREGLDPEQLWEVAGDVWDQRRAIVRDRETALRQIRNDSFGRRQATAGQLAAWENAGKDHSSYPGWDDFARSMASRYPELGLSREGYGYDQEAVEDAPAQLWDLIRRGAEREPARHSPEVLAEAVAMLQEWRKPAKPLTPEQLELMRQEFCRRGDRLRYCRQVLGTLVRGRRLRYAA